MMELSDLESILMIVSTRIGLSQTEAGRDKKTPMSNQDDKTNDGGAGFESFLIE